MRFVWLGTPLSDLGKHTAAKGDQEIFAPTSRVLLEPHKQENLEIIIQLNLLRAATLCIRIPSLKVKL
jgi:hypothetical protein